MTQTKTIAALAVAIVLAPSNAHAYLDPGSAAMALQAIIAAAAGVFATIKLWGHRIRSWIGLTDKKTERKDDE